MNHDLNPQKWGLIKALVKLSADVYVEHGHGTMTAFFGNRTD